MLIKTTDIPKEKFDLYFAQLQQAMQHEEIMKSIAETTTAETLATCWESSAFPKIGCTTFFSVQGDELQGICQYYTLRQEYNFVHCTEVLTYNFSNKNIVFGKDCIDFYSYLNENVHKVNMTINGTFTEEDYATEYGKPFENLLRHLQPYGGRYVGYFKEHTRNALGQIVDVHMVEFITDKGKALGK